MINTNKRARDQITYNNVNQYYEDNFSTLEEACKHVNIKYITYNRICKRLNLDSIAKPRPLEIIKIYNNEKKEKIDINNIDKERSYVKESETKSNSGREKSSKKNKICDDKKRNIL